MSRSSQESAMASALPSASANQKAELKQTIESTPPEDFICSLSMQIFFDPVITETGQVYEREVIQKWFKEKKTDPLTGKSLPHEGLVRDKFRESEIEKFLKVNPHCYKNVYLPEQSFLTAVRYGDQVEFERLLRKDIRFLVNPFENEEVKGLCGLDIVCLEAKADEVGLKLLRTIIHFAHRYDKAEVKSGGFESDFKIMPYWQKRVKSAVAEPKLLNQLLLKGIVLGLFEELDDALILGANPDAKQEDENALLLAVRHNNLAAIKRLQTSGSKIDACNSRGKTILHLAAESENLELLPHLVQIDKKLLEFKDDKAQTPLSNAIAEGKLKAAALLVNHGASLDSEDKEGNTPLHLTIGIDGADEMIFQLLESGANLWALNRQGQTPWDLAKQKDIDLANAMSYFERDLWFHSTRYKNPPFISQSSERLESKVTKLIPTQFAAAQSFFARRLLPPKVVPRLEACFGAGPKGFHRFKQLLTALTGVFVKQQIALSEISKVNCFTPNTQGVIEVTLALADVNTLKCFKEYYTRNHPNLITIPEELVEPNTYRFLLNVRWLFPICEELKKYHENSHENLMKKMAHDLQVPDSEVKEGVAVEQALVNYAGIEAKQEGAMFRRDNTQYFTYFQLRLSAEQSQQFTKYYNTRYPSFLLKPAQIENEWAKIEVNSKILLEEISPSLGQFKKALLPSPM